MSLSVTVQNASNLPKPERFKKLKVFVTLIFQGSKCKTKAVPDNLDPVWNETFEWSLQTVPARTEVIFVEVYDLVLISKNRLIGIGEISMFDVMTKISFCQILQLKGWKGDPLMSKLILDINYVAPAGGRALRVQEGTNSTANPQIDTEEVDERYDVNEKGGLTAPLNLCNDGTSELEKQRRENDLAKLPDELTDFEIHLHVIEARKLVGAELNPVVKVSCGNQVKWTKPCKGTKNPIFDEILCFKFREYPKKLCSITMKMSVLNSMAKFLDSLIGSSKFDVGIAYDELECGFTCKWTLLCNPDQLSRGSQGFLKFSIRILMPGEKQITSSLYRNSELVNKESSLLDPFGVRPPIKSLNIKVYWGEGLPQMDPDFFTEVQRFRTTASAQTGLVDPYCLVNFAGHTGNTKVIWKEHNPIWNEQFNLAVMFPTVSERIMFRLMDKDKLSEDDLIGTHFMNLADISSPAENGFLPTFGPCFVNIYGSPREFTCLPDKYEHLNKGLMEGVSFRGRVMIEVNMEKDEVPSEKYSNIENEEISKLTPFLRRRRYKLFAAFYSATMIKPAHEAVKFEVSIGNYGNSQETDYPLQSSTTPSVHPLCGSSCYYLPWIKQKPCVNVESLWEDNTYRIESQNLLLFIADVLRTSLDKVQKMKVQERSTHFCRNELINGIKKATRLIRQGIPQLPPNAYTNLDKLKRSAREEDLSLMLEEAQKLLRTEEGKLKDDLAYDTLFDAAHQYYTRLTKLAGEPQNSIPDVIICMFSGKRRVAYHRIPSHQLMYSASEEKRGKLCGKVQNIILKPPAQEKTEELEDPDFPSALVRCVIWLGLEQDQSKWGNVDQEGEIEVFAETYENQVFNGSLKPQGKAMPEWSDCEGKTMQRREDFELAPGWEWASEWKISPISISDLDEEREELQEEIFEYQSKRPSSFWPIDYSESKWSNSHGEDLTSSEEIPLLKDSIRLNEGWTWTNDWQIDTNRACDEDGWEYMPSADLDTEPSVKPFERNSDLCRRRRWVRTRVYMYNRSRKSDANEAREERWEYAKSHFMSYHSNKRESDTVCRRRWLRKVTQDKPGHRIVFNVKSMDDHSQGKHQSPRIFLLFKEPHKYQLRAYIYLAIDLYSKNKTRHKDPFCKVLFDHYSQTTRVITGNHCPIWDQMLIFESIYLFGYPLNLQKSPPSIVIEIYNRECSGQDKFLGIVKFAPVVKLIPEPLPPSLEWYEVMRYGRRAGKLLASCELLLEMAIMNEIKEDPTKTHYTVPEGIKPTCRKMIVEVYCRGVRELPSTTSQPYVVIEHGEKIVKTKPIINVMKNNNFPEPLLIFDVDLPKEEKYSLPFKIMIFNDNGYGQSSFVGTACIGKSLQRFEHDDCKYITEMQELRPQSKVTVKEVEKEVIIELPKSPKFDWWSKYYASINDEENMQQEYLANGNDLMEVYDCELECQFDDFGHYYDTYPVLQAKDACDQKIVGDHTLGYFKGAIKVYPLPDDGDLEDPKVIYGKHYKNFPSPEPVDIEVRVYVIKGINLQPRDRDGKSDPYLVVSLGDKEVNDDQENRISNTCNPLFGKMFKISGTLPLDYILRVKVMDYDLTSAHDLIGETMIDLEDRFFSQYRSTCGLPQSFSSNGPNRWRDYEFPKEILNWYSEKQGCPVPVWNGSEQVEFNGKTYNLEDFNEQQQYKCKDVDYPDQRLALHILHEQGLFREHIETRKLYHPMYPGVPQGALHMWIDIFPKKARLPDPVDITPRELKTSISQISENAEEFINEERIKPPKTLDVFNLLKQKAHKWSEIGRDLCVGYDYRQALLKRTMNENDEHRLEDILHKWIESQCSEVSWKNLIGVLKGLKLNDAVGNILHNLKSQIQDDV